MTEQPDDERLLGALEELCEGQSTSTKPSSSSSSSSPFAKQQDDVVDNSNTKRHHQRPINTKGSATTWLQDEKSWEVYQGLSVVERMEMVKAALKEGVASLEGQGSDETKGAAAAMQPEEVMMKTTLALQQTLPADLRGSLPWSALINLINTGFNRIGWSVMGKEVRAAATAAAAGDGGATSTLTLGQCQTAMKEALNGVIHWLPDAALDHSSAPTVDPASLGPQLTIEEYQVGR